MKKLLPILFLPACIASGQLTILDETFPAGGRTSLNAPASAAWYSSSSGTTVTYTDGTSINQATGDSGRHLLAYFTPHGSPVTLVNTGDYVQATFTFTFNGTPGGSASNTTAWRLGLFDSSGGTRVTADAINSAAAFNGYTGYIYTASPSSAANSAFRERTTTNAALISDNTAYTAFTGSGTSQALTFGSTYTGVLTYTRTTTGLDLTVSFTGPNITNYTYTRSDTSPTYTFDTFAFHNVSNVSDSFTIHSLQVTAIPEPSTYAVLIGVLALGLVVYRRRLHQPLNPNRQ